MNDRLRVQFDFSPDALARLEALQEQAKAKTKADIVRKALSIYEWLWQQDPETIIEMKEQDGHVLVHMPIHVLRSMLT